MRLERSFFERHTPSVARDLLGCTLVRKSGRRVISGRIVEVEAYRGSDDPASHSYRGKTARNSLMFGEAGHVYMFFIYGNHWCLNFTAEPEGRKPGAVLVRALEPVEGIGEMAKNRGTSDTVSLTNGPGKLTQALGIDGSFYGEDLVTSERLFVLSAESPVRRAVSSRIGVSQGHEQKWRYFVKGNRFVSKGYPSRVKDVSE